jgi:hypothetical protein
MGLLLGEYFLEYFWKNLLKNHENYLILKYYYVKVYVKYFEICLIFKSFEVY